MSKIINFANQDLPESSNGLEDYIGYLRTTADILEGCNIYAQDMGTSTLAVIGLDFSEFSFVSEKSTTSPEGLISLTYMYQSQNAVYTVVFDNQPPHTRDFSRELGCFFLKYNGTYGII